MERIRQLWNNINAQMSLLSVSQRLAIGLCAALAVVSLLWLMQWSSEPELVPLVTQDFAPSELATAEQTLRTNGIPSQTVGGTRLFVRASDKRNALRLVNEADALPDGSLFDMEAIMSDSNPFEAPGQRKFRQNYAVSNELAKIIATSPAVRQARVMINPDGKRRVGADSDVPTASVTVTLAPSQSMTMAMVEGFAKLVAGAVAGLKPHNVYITDASTMQSYSLPHPDDAMGFDVLTRVKQREEHYRSKILDALADIPGLRVAVSVDLDMTKTLTTNVKHDKPEPKEEMADTTDQSSGGGAAEPGVQANLGRALTAAAPGTSNTTEKTSSTFFPANMSQTERIEQLPFAIKGIAAAIGIPRSFVLNVFRAQAGDPAADPKDDDLAFAATRKAQVARVHESVKRIVMAKNAGDVQVDIYPDMEWTPEGGSWSNMPGAVMRADGGADGMDTMALLSKYGPQGGLGLLALISLFMMMRVVRKSSDLVGSRGAQLDFSEQGDEEITLAVGSGAVGEAEASESWLAGREVDPDTLRFQELGSEVSKMVEGDPEGTADLIRRWVESSE